MSAKRKKILIADNQDYEIQDLRRSLVAEGYEVRIATLPQEIAPLIQQFNPDITLISSSLPELNPENLIAEIKENEDQSYMPIVFAGNPRMIDARLELFNFDIDDFILKPFEPEEVMVRLEILLKEAQIARENGQITSGGFNGTLEEMTLVDLLQTMEVGKKTAHITLFENEQEGHVYILNGNVIHVTLGNFEAKQSLFKMFTWQNGRFIVSFEPVNVEKNIHVTTQELISEGVTRQYRWKKITSELPKLTTFIQKKDVTFISLNNDELKLIDILTEPAKISDVISNSSFDDLKTLRVVKSLFEKSAVEVVENSLALTADENTSVHIAKVEAESENESPMQSAFTKALRNTGESKAPKFDRRKGDRRSANRVSPNDRRSYKSHPGNVCLNKSELIMFRNKLLTELKHQNGSE